MSDVCSGLVTFIALYHYIRIFNSWVESYEFPAPTTGEEAAPMLTEKPFNDARTVTWTSSSLCPEVLLMELLLVMDMPKEEKQKQPAIPGFTSASMIAAGAPSDGTNKGCLWSKFALGGVSVAQFVRF